MRITRSAHRSRFKIPTATERISVPRKPKRTRAAVSVSAKHGTQLAAQEFSGRAIRPGRHGKNGASGSVSYSVPSSLNTLLAAIYQHGIKRRYYPGDISWRRAATYPSGSPENFPVAPLNVPRRRSREGLTAIVCSRKCFVYGGRNDDCKSP